MAYSSWTKGKNSLYLENDTDRLRIPLAGGDEFLINWLGSWESTFINYSYVDILNAYREKISGEEPGLDLKAIEGSICIVT